MHVRLAPGTSLTDIEGKSVLFSVKTGDTYGLNDTAAEMLRLSIAQGVAQAAEAIARDYDIDVADVRADLDALMRELTALKFVQVADAHGS